MYSFIKKKIYVYVDGATSKKIYEGNILTDLLDN